MTCLLEKERVIPEKETALRQSTKLSSQKNTCWEQSGREEEWKGRSLKKNTRDVLGKIQTVESFKMPSKGI